MNLRHTNNGAIFGPPCSLYTMFITNNNVLDRCAKDSVGLTTAGDHSISRRTISYPHSIQRQSSSYCKLVQRTYTDVSCFRTEDSIRVILELTLNKATCTKKNLTIRYASKISMCSKTDIIVYLVDLSHEITQQINYKLEEHNV